MASRILLQGLQVESRIPHRQVLLMESRDRRSRLRAFRTSLPLKGNSPRIRIEI
jgi:hypothetical protein